MKMQAMLHKILIRIVLFWKRILTATLTCGLIVALAVAPAKITGSEADDFFSTYFAKVTDSGQLQGLYDNDFTADYRRFESWKLYAGFWKSKGQVTPDEAIPGGNPLEFTETLTLHPISGGSQTLVVNYYLTCSGLIGNIIAHLQIVGCPPRYIKIDRLKWVSMTTN